MAASDPHLRVTIRNGLPDDVPALAALTGQLGYPISEEVALDRLRLILEQPESLLLVAEWQGEVIGWVHARIRCVLFYERHAEIEGLVVSEEYRSRQVGTALLNTAEAWARQMDCSFVMLRSNATRERTHQFYLQNGYGHIKNWYAFRRDLGTRP